MPWTHECFLQLSRVGNTVKCDKLQIPHAQPRECPALHCLLSFCAHPSEHSLKCSHSAALYRRDCRAWLNGSSNNTFNPYSWHSDVQGLDVYSFKHLTLCQCSLLWSFGSFSSPLSACLIGGHIGGLLGFSLFLLCYCSVISLHCKAPWDNYCCNLMLNKIFALKNKLFDFCWCEKLTFWCKFFKEFMNLKKELCF